MNTLVNTIILVCAVVMVILVTSAASNLVHAETCRTYGNRTLCTSDDGTSRTCTTSDNTTYCTDRS